MEVLLVIQVGLAVWLYRYFAKSERGTKEPTGELQRACFFGAAAAIAAGFINDQFLPQSILEHSDTVIPKLSESFRGSLFVGFNEELLKFAPLAVYIYKKPFFDELTDGVIYFGLAGMWFGVLENIGYTLVYGAGAGVVRIVVAPFLHAGFTAMVGTGLVRYKFVTHNKLTIMNWLLLAVGLHALYNFSLFSGTGVGQITALILAIGINLSAFYLLKITQRADEAAGRSAAGINTFCRNCGKSNTDHYLYCMYCGQKT